MSSEPGPEHADRVVGTDRVLAVLLALAERPRGATLDELATAVASPKPTVHRALSALCRAGLAAHIERGFYMVGDDFLRLALENLADRPDALLITPALESLARRFGETTHYAVLDGRDVVYRAKVDPPGGAVRLTSVVGGRNPAHSTAVGKVLLGATVSNWRELTELLGPGPLPRRTPRTIETLDALWREVALAQEQGFAVDDQENEPGVNCVAVPLPQSRSLRGPGAVSVSALAFRLPLPALVEQVAAITAAVSTQPRP